MALEVGGLQKGVPSAQAGVNIFEGEWAYRLPIESVDSGTGDGFEKKHISVFLSERNFGSLKGMSCVELGPNEAEVSFHLHHAGCAEIVSVEARIRSFLKCLVVKNYLKLDSVTFQLGDFQQYLEQTERVFDLCVAAGVLYHMEDPIRLIEMIAKRSERLALATHYYSPEILAIDSRLDSSGMPPVSWKLVPNRQTLHDVGGFEVTYYAHEYTGNIDDHETFGHGGILTYANFMTREDIVRVLEFYGFQILELVDSPQGPRGPFLSLVGRKKESLLGARKSRQRLDWKQALFREGKSGRFDLFKGR